MWSNSSPLGSRIKAPGLRNFQVTFFEDKIIHIMTAITGLCVVYGKNASPPSKYSIIRNDLNAGAKGEYVYLCYSTDACIGHPISAIQVLSGDNDDFPIPPGYTKVDGDVNKGTGPDGKYIYVCYACAECSPLVTKVDVLIGESQYTYPADNKWIRVNQDCNQGVGGRWVYIAYKY